MNRTASHFARPVTQSCERRGQPLRWNLWPLAVLAYCIAVWAALIWAVL